MHGCQVTVKVRSETLGVMEILGSSERGNEHVKWQVWGERLKGQTWQSSVRFPII